MGPTLLEGRGSWKPCWNWNRWTRSVMTSQLRDGVQQVQTFCVNSVLNTIRTFPMLLVFKEEGAMYFRWTYFQIRGRDRLDNRARDASVSSRVFTNPKKTREEFSKALGITKYWYGHYEEIPLLLLYYWNIMYTIRVKRIVDGMYVSRLRFQSQMETVFDGFQFWKWINIII